MFTIVRKSLSEIALHVAPKITLCKACRTRELSAEQKFFREHWRKQNPPLCSKILKDFCGTRDANRHE
jgi:hypothetical protein